MISYKVCSISHKEIWALKDERIKTGMLEKKKVIIRTFSYSMYLPYLDSNSDNQLESQPDTL